MIFLVHIDDKGGLDFGSTFNKSRFLDYCRNNPGKLLRITHEELKRSRSQNNLYWVFLHAIAKETGNDADDIHEYAKRKFLPPRFITINGEEYKIPGTTTGLSKNDFSEYMDKVSAWSGVPIPNPADAGYLSNY